MALIYIDFDGVLAEHTTWKGFDHIGHPIPAMLEKVKTWLAVGDEVVIFTARVSNFNVHGVQKFDVEAITKTIQDWTERHLGRRLKVTATKGPWDYCCDDSIEQVVRNTGLTLQEHVRSKIADLRLDYSREVVESLNELEDFMDNLQLHAKP